MARAGGWLGLRLKDATTRLTGRVESCSPLLLLLCVCAGVMSDAGEKDKCADLKLIYSKCFNTWCPPSPPPPICASHWSQRGRARYTEKFLKGDTAAACQLEFEAYRVRAPLPLTTAVRMHQ
jgi:hypothetical protein